ncbi:tryptophan halogenase family protein [Sphingomicrobium sp. XHP0239]|uniref:tryptophan halogenase family protein n=1 Tax=Sphingomicrobium maritimum TaxID=3133972 RepID=UPI0031CC5596
MEPQPQRVVIAGGGSAGWMAAAAIARTMGRAVRLTLVESEAIGTVGVGEATIPQIHHFNRLLDLREGEFLAATKGTLKLGIEFDGWHRPGASYMHAFGTVGRGFGIAPFRHAFAWARARGMEAPFGAFCFNEVAARAGRYHPDAATSTIPPLVHAYHFDAGLYASLLRTKAEDMGVERVEGRIDEVAVRDGRVTSLRLQDGSEVAGDLFIDCSGFRSLLIGEALGVGFDDWSEWLPCDRAVAVPSAGGELRPYTQAIARQAGWQWRIPLQHRTGNGHVFSSRHMSEDEATATLLDNLEGEALAEPRVIRFTTGRRAEPWRGNVVALGLAAGFMEPLESTSIHLVQSGIERLLQLFPDGSEDAARRSRFNDQSTREWEAIRDFLIAHYHLNAREGQAFWDERREAGAPESLTTRLAAFREAGIVVRDADELFTDEGWQQLLIGQGVTAERWHPAIDAMDGDELIAFLDTLARAYEARAKTLPRHEDYLDHVMKEAA